ncbi:MAG TPA: hypothetical protein VF725_00425 [Ktedonobacterales bacterium]
MNARNSAPRSARAITVLLALGGYLIFTGLALLLPFGLSSLSIQNDVYMANLFLAPLFGLVGAVVLLIGAVLFLRAPAMRGRLLWARALLLAIIGAGVVVGATFVFGGHYESFPPGSVYWPPYLSGELFIAVVAIGAAVGVGGWLWGATTGTLAGGADSGAPA